MSSNIFKGNFIQFTSENTRVIDSQALFAKRMEENSSVLRAHENEEFEPQYDEEGNLIEGEESLEEIDQIAAITEDYEEGNEGFAPLQKDSFISHDEVRAECDEMLKDATNEAESIIENARKEAEQIKEAAKDAGYQEGYQAGKKQAEAEYEGAKNELELEKANLAAEYNELVKDIEPKMVDTITAVYEHVFGSNFYNRRDIMIYLINKALMAANASDKVIIYVSFEDYDRIYNMKPMLFDRTTFTEEPEIKPREDLNVGESKIETPFGIMDCSIDTELRELTRALRLMSCGDN